MSDVLVNVLQRKAGNYVRFIPSHQFTKNTLMKFPVLEGTSSGLRRTQKSQELTRSILKW